MKIKISKRQWEEMGKKAGWIKKSSQTRYLTWTSDYNPEMVSVDHKQNLLDAGYNDAWQIVYRHDVEFDDKNDKGQPLASWQILSQFLMSALNLFTDEKIEGGINIIRKLNLDTNEFWQLISANDSEWDEEQRMEKYERERDERDTQEIGDYEKYGPDPITPQY